MDTFTFERLGADRMPCPICGHPTGDCTPPGGSGHVRVLPYEDPTKDESRTFTVDREVHQQVRLNGRRLTRVRLYHVGERITPEEAERVGLLDDDLPPVIVLPPAMASGKYGHLATPD